MLMRPKTGLKDMVAELEPGTPGSGRLRDGDVIPISETLPDVNLDEILASLDTDSRDYLTILVGAGAEGLRGNGARARAGDPPLRAVGALRAQGVRRARQAAEQHQARHPQPLAGDGRARRQGRPGRRVRRELQRRVRHARAPGREPARDAASSCRPRSTRRSAGSARPSCSPTSSGRRCRRCGPAPARSGRRCARVRPFVRETTPVIRDEIRPFVRASRPTVKELRPAMNDLATATPDLTRTFKVVNYLLDSSPTTRRARRRATCSGSPGRTTSAIRSSPPRTRTARSAAACSSPPARTSRCSSRSPRPTRCSAR